LAVAKFGNGPGIRATAGFVAVLIATWVANLIDVPRFFTAFTIFRCSAKIEK
jgi:hypothetical protein